MASLLKRAWNKISFKVLHYDLSPSEFCKQTSKNGRHFNTTLREESEENDKSNIVLPPEPQDCCMSGCANCVWIKYAEDVAKILGDDGEAAKAAIIKNVKDPNLRAFLMMELQDLFKKK